jgi:hypothetical protein
VQLRSIVVATALVLAAFAGCIGGDEEGIPNNLQAEASNPVLSFGGFAYDGEDAVSGSGSATLVIDNESGTGTLNGSLGAEGDSVNFRADTFSGDPDNPWEANGINQGITVHGDTGRAAPTLPELNLITGTWGPVQITQNGEPVPDPLTGQQTFQVHTMLTDTGVRDDSSRQILAQDGSPYNPDKAGEGQTTDGDEEFIVEIFSDPSAPVFEDATSSDSGSLDPESSTAEFPFPVKATTATFEVNASISSSDPTGALPQAPAEVNVSLVDPTGTMLKAATLGPGGPDDPEGQSEVAWSIDDVSTTGNYTIQFDANGAADWEASSSVDYPEPFFLLAVYEDVTYGAAGSGEE